MLTVDFTKRISLKKDVYLDIDISIHCHTYHDKNYVEITTAKWYKTNKEHYCIKSERQFNNSGSHTLFMNLTAEYLKTNKYRLCGVGTYINGKYNSALNNYLGSSWY